MNFLYWPPRLEITKAWWKQTFGGDVFWPWFTLIGTLVTLSIAGLVRAVLPPRSQIPDLKSDMEVPQSR